MNLTLPFEPYEFQKDVIAWAGNKERCLLGSFVGSGKTCMAAVIALNSKPDKILLLAPPILLPGWEEYLNQIKVNGHDLSVLVYRGTPKQRKAMDFAPYDVVMMSPQIFKGDFDRVWEDLKHDDIYVVVDEASFKSPTTSIFKKFKHFMSIHGGWRKFCLLTATPGNQPYHFFPLIKLMQDHYYRNKYHFEWVHVTKKDFFGVPIKWDKLDLLKKRFEETSKILTLEDVGMQLPAITYHPVLYDLDPKHRALYEKLLNERLLELDNGEIIDAVTVQALYNSSQQIIVSPPDDKIKPKVNELLEVYIDRDEQTVVFSKYRMSNRSIAEFIEGTMGLKVSKVWGDISRTEQDKNIQKFLNKETQVLVANYASAGFGLNLQEHCRSVIFVELPTVHDYFVQSVGRVYRQGQTKPVIVHQFIAKNTIQETIRRKLAEKSDLIGKVLPDVKKMRKCLFP